MMDEKPEWVPDWVWDEFEHYSTPTPGYEHDKIGIISSVLVDESCKVVWDAIDRRCGEANRRRKIRFKELGWRDLPMPIGEAENLFYCIAQSASGIPADAAISGVNRKAISKKIERHASALLDEINSLNARCGVDYCCNSPINGFELDPASVLAQKVIQENLKMPRHREEWTDDDCTTMFGFGVVCGMGAIEEALAGLIAVTKEWGSSKPPVARLNDDGAHRLYFIREMTKWFNKNYGTPLREPVAALTRSIFNCDIDAAAIAQLAPCSETSE